MSTTITITDPAELLDKAADEIERRGWTRREYADLSQPTETAPVCAVGAISVALTGYPIPDEGRAYERDQFEAVLGHLVERVGRDGRAYTDEAALAYWNDAEGRTAEQVATEMRAAARQIREDGAA